MLGPVVGALRHQPELERHALAGGLVLNPTQCVLGAVVLMLVAGLVGASQWTNRVQQERQAALARTESATLNSLYTMRESMNLTSAFEAYLAGRLPRRDVQIARSLLGRRLSVVDQSGNPESAKVGQESSTR